MIMPSYARRHQLNRSLFYHALNRSNARVTIFHCENDYLYFINLLKEYTLCFGFKLYHWVIMSNHYHILFEAEEPDKISKCMAGLARAYTHYYHRTYQTSGFLWQGRFKLQPIQKENYLIACGRYIERNPVRAGIVEEAHSYSYSSAAFYCIGKADPITHENPLYASFGNTPLEIQSRYRNFLRNFDAEEENSFRRLQEPKGDKEFIRRLVKENGRYLPRRKGKLRKY